VQIKGEQASRNGSSMAFALYFSTSKFCNCSLVLNTSEKLVLHVNQKCHLDKNNRQTQAEDAVFGNEKDPTVRKDSDFPTR